jgi:hypothetical protein
MLIERFGHVMAYWLVAGGLALIGVIASIVVSVKEHEEEVAEQQAVNTDTQGVVVGRIHMRGPTRLRSQSWQREVSAVYSNPRPSHGSTMRFRIAYRTSAAGEERLSLRMMAARCVSTVLTLIFNRPAICLLV